MKRATVQEIGNECMGLHLRRAARRVSRVYDEALAPFDLTIGQFSLLTALAGQDHWGMQPLAEALGMDRSSVTAMLKPLERRKLISSETDEHDRRARILMLTQAGTEILQAAEPHWRDAQQRVVTLIGSDNAAAARAAFSTLT